MRLDRGDRIDNAIPVKITLGNVVTAAHARLSAAAVRLILLSEQRPDHAYDG